MNVATTAVRSTPATTTLLGKLRALVLHALHLHVQNCAVIAEAYRRPL